MRKLPAHDGWQPRFRRIEATPEDLGTYPIDFDLPGGGTRVCFEVVPRRGGWPLLRIMVEEQDNAGVPAFGYSPTGTHLVAEAEHSNPITAMRLLLERYERHSCRLCKAGRPK